MSHVVYARINFFKVTKPELFLFEVKDYIQLILANTLAIVLVQLLD
jgi:hypothetical protein